MKGPKTRSLYCCGCRAYVFARLTDGFAIYGERNHDALRFYWQCPECKNYVGCHHKTKDPIKPLGTIPTPRLRGLRRRFHIAMDPLWRNGEIDRSKLYKAIALRMGRAEFHTAELNSPDDYDRAMAALRDVEKVYKIGRVARMLKEPHDD